MLYIESSIRAPVLLNSLNSLRRIDKCLATLFSSTRLINSIKHEHSCVRSSMCLVKNNAKNIKSDIFNGKN